MTGFTHDLRYGFRTLVKSPGFTTIAILTLALGIGANTAIFSVINAVMLRSLPVRAPQQLAIVGDSSRAHALSTGSPQRELLSVPLYRELQRQQDVFDGMAATGYLGPASMVSFDQVGQTTTPERAYARMVSGNFFSVLGVDAVQGRVFRDEADGPPGSAPVAVISYAYWKRQFNQDQHILGRTLRVNGFPLTIIGVMPQGFMGEVVGDSLDLWVPLNMQRQVLPGFDRLDNVEASWLVLFGRLKPGLTVEQAHARLQVTYQNIANSSFASRYRGEGNIKMLRELRLEVGPGAGGISQVRRDFSHPLVLLLMMVALVLLIACVNVANLLLARSASRRKEIAVRLAIGGSPARIIRQLLTESMLLAFLGGGFGLLLAPWGVRGLLGVVRRGGRIVPLDTSPDLRVLGFTTLACVLAGILFGLAPALRARRLELTPALNSATRDQGGSSASGSRWNVGRVLVSAQVALSVLVLFAAGLLVQSLRKLQAIDTGYQRQHLLIARVHPRIAGYRGATYVAFCDDLLRRFRSLPGVSAVTYSENGLFSGTESNDGIAVPGFQPRTDEDAVAYDDTVGPNYFTTIGIPLLLGRDLGPQDIGAQPKVAVINETMARFYFGDQNPIGRTFRIPDDPDPGPTLEIVGVARDVRDHKLREAPQRRFYMPESVGRFSHELNFELRGSGDSAALTQAVRAAVRDANPQVPVLSLATVDELVDENLADQIFIARLSGFFAALALLLACVGLYGITSFAVAGRTREIGVRIALGAQPGSVLWLVMREALLLVAAGLIIGIPAAVVSSRVLQAMLFEVSSTNAGALALPTAILALVGIAAAYLPARRATRVDPMVALRYE